MYKTPPNTSPIKKKYNSPVKKLMGSDFEKECQEYLVPKVEELSRTVSSTSALSTLSSPAKNKKLINISEKFPEYVEEVMEEASKNEEQNLSTQKPLNINVREESIDYSISDSNLPFLKGNSNSSKYTLIAAAAKLKPYFIPKTGNWYRTCGTTVSLIIVPTAAIVFPFLILENEVNNKNKFVPIFLATIVSVMINLSQESINVMLTLSTENAINKDNILKLTQEPLFLVHSNTKDISSLQYVTAGRGVTDFTHNAIPVLVGIPTSIATSIATFAYIYSNTGSVYSVLATASFVSASVILTSYLGNRYAKYAKDNLKIVNKLVGTINNIEACKDSITSMGALTTEARYGIEQVNLISKTIPTLTIIYSSYTFLTYISPIISNNFLGNYYTDNNKPLSDVTLTTLNILIVSLVNNAQKMALALTAHYPFIEVNLRELLNFDKAFEDSLKASKYYEAKTKVSFGENHITLTNFSIFTIDKCNNEKVIIDTLNLKLNPNTVYKLSADSGTGKTLFLNSIKRNWSYVSGKLTLPTNTEDICFVPKDTFIPCKRNLLEVLTYPLTLSEYLAKYNNQEANNTLDNLKQELIKDIKELFIEFNLYNSIDVFHSITLDTLESQEIDWDQRLSGGERQRIGIIRALLTKPSFIIMDEATNAIDLASKIRVFDKVKEVLAKNINWYLVYTEHDKNTDTFADYILNMTNQKIYIEENYPDPSVFREWQSETFDPLLDNL